MAKFIILSGPSCVGKGPLVTALKRFHPDLTEGWEKLVLYNSRSPRPGEKDGVDYFFRRRERIEELRENPHYFIQNVRGDLQAVDMEQLRKNLERSPVFFEGNPMLVNTLRNTPFVEKIDTFAVFLSPLSQDEILYLRSQTPPVDLQAFVTDMMRRKLLRRTQKQKTILSLKDLEDIERRACSALKEMTYACGFDYVIANHDGEDSENWDAFYFPIGDAYRTLDCFAALLQDRSSPAAEQWESDILSNVLEAQNE